MVSAFFKNVAQKNDSDSNCCKIALLSRRKSSSEMKEKFARLFARLQEVLIGTPRAPVGRPDDREYPDQLRSRQVAREQIETYKEQEKPAVQERTLNEAKATAAAQLALTQSSIQVRVHEMKARAALARAHKDAETVK